MPGVSRYGEVRNEGPQPSQQQYSTDSSIDDRPPLQDVTQRCFSLLNSLRGRTSRQSESTPKAQSLEMKELKQKELVAREPVHLDAAVAREPVHLDAANGSPKRFLANLETKPVIRDPKTNVAYQAYNYLAPSGWTALHFTAWKSNRSIQEQAEKCRDLLRKKALFVKDNFGMTPFHIVSHFGNYLVAFEFLSAIKEIRLNVYGQTPLHLVTPKTMTRNNIIICAMLLLSNHPTQIKDEYDETPFETVTRQIKIITARLNNLHIEEESIPSFGITSKQKSVILERKIALSSQIAENETLLNNLETVRNMLLNWERASDSLKNKYIPEWRKILTENHKNLRQWQKYFETLAIINAYKRDIKTNPDLEKPQEVIEGMPRQPEDLPIRDVPAIIESFITTFAQADFPTGDVQKKVMLTEIFKNPSGEPLTMEDYDPGEGPADISNDSIMQRAFRELEEDVKI